MHLERLVEQAFPLVSAPSGDGPAGDPAAARPPAPPADRPTSFEASLYEPVLCLILQAKETGLDRSAPCRSARASASS